jgi:citrate/tricarballylate utilization protein
MQEDDILQEADRLMTICNACRYCEGLCAVFPAMEMRRAFTAGDLSYLSNLCHDCGACYVDCPFSPPHEFDVNVPKTLAAVRARSYADYAWPRFLAPLFIRNALALAVAVPAGIGAFMLCLILQGHPLRMSLQPAVGGADFYALIPHEDMVVLFGSTFLYGIIAIIMGGRQFWRHMGPAPAHTSLSQALWQAFRDAAALRYLDGGGDGCSGALERKRDYRRLFHHLTAYGFLLCFGATSLATIYHYLLKLEAPYAWWEPPVLLGTAGGIGLVVGSAGLLVEKFRRDRALSDSRTRGMEIGFIGLLLLSGVSGLLLTVLRDSVAMPVLLALHLGVVLTFFPALPYSKFVHGLYRFLALVRSAQERQH